jgi:predicted  nucleic acid-binding Zn-ribbon protein
LRKLERTYRAREQLAEGLHMIDFEQLKIENQTLHEKIEERNEELVKLKRKKTITVQVLTHAREKLRYYEHNNKVTQLELNDLETEILKLRSEVAITKRARDALREDNKDLKLKQGFASNDLLTADFERRKKSIYAIKDKIRDLQERYRALSAQVIPYESYTPKPGGTLNMRGSVKRSKFPPHPGM